MRKKWEAEANFRKYMIKESNRNNLKGKIDLIN